MKKHFIALVAFLPTIALANSRIGTMRSLPGMDNGDFSGSLNVFSSSSIDVVKFHQKLASGRIQFDVGALVDGKIQGIQNFELKPAEFTESENEYLRAIKQSANNLGEWIVVSGKDIPGGAKPVSPNK